ncbi:fatty acid desaturase [Trichocoleus sp. FACHB-591]|uniref:fatty acid desaturase n=1 Tax=Trichocoleus sp. FACHB-591 TaxID=2692872 RepID=UPI001688DA86|nr:fatty acid desaturase [Trichocoleus sp. FACHB-591]MBD2097361.1 fatty acid desaturase [Trichocoleus sp. FACHB-591]
MISTLGTSSPETAAPAKIRTDGDYIRTLRPLLPKEAFQQKPSHIFHFLTWLSLALICILLAHLTSNVIFLLLISCLYGHSLAGLALFGHYLSHGSVLPPGLLRSCLEVVTWGFNLIPRTVWVHVHNHTHHPHAGTLKDSDRPWLTSEQTWLRKVYSMIFYPQKFERFPWFVNPLPLTHFVTYGLRNVIGVFWTQKNTLHFIPYQKPYTWQERAAVIGEIGFIATLQVLLFISLQGHFTKYYFMGILPPFISSAVLLIYVKTHHFPNPIAIHNNSVLATTSVIVHPLFNFIHSNLSYHSEHHLFPSMNPDYYPLVSQLLQQHFPADYNQIPIGEAWKRILNRSTFETLTILQK